MAKYLLMTSEYEKSMQALQRLDLYGLNELKYDYLEIMIENLFQICQYE